MNTTTVPDPPHSLPYAEVADGLVTDTGRGLAAAEAAARLRRDGPNVLPAARRRGPVLRFLLQFHSPLIYVLLVSAAVTAALGEHVDAAVILGVVLVNAVVGFVQEARAEQALAALVALTRTVSTVVRDGRPLKVPSEELVRGDLVVLDAGDKVPADLRLVRTAELKADESALTGESAPVGKDPAPVGDVTLADRRSMAYSGTFVSYGQGAGIVTATGADTEIGLVHRLVGQATAVQTPLTRKIARFSKVVTAAILGLAAVTFAIGLLRGMRPFASVPLTWATTGGACHATACAGW